MLFLLLAVPVAVSVENGDTNALSENITSESSAESNELDLNYNPENVESEAKSIIEKANQALDNENAAESSPENELDNQQPERTLGSRIGQIIFGLVLVVGGVLYFINKKR